MPLTETSSPVVGGTDDPSYGPPENDHRVLREYITHASNASALTFVRKIPPRCQVLFATLKSAAAVSFGTQTAVGGSAASATATVSADRYALLFSTATTYPTATQNGSAGAIIIGATGTASNSGARTVAMANTNLMNTTTSDWYLYVLPYSSATGSWAENVRPATAATQTTAGLRFGTATGAFDIQVVYQAFIADTPDR